ncbi:ABC transporter permease subunit [Bosea sp. BK604]|uniref:ABC transporter permease n=1 Tax=Bosea sp. BK604 TaxID=2512180 RepID=UPI001045880F|nr:ABC transporter permease subunit [Bosea sp. BK604]TCR62554.1 NitT/TauT family transport system permease protein [Bosea sp. BK604]
MKIWIARILFAAAVLALWEWGSRIPLLGQLPIFDPFIVSTPSGVARQLVKLYGQSRLAMHVGYTLLATVLGLIAGLLTGFGAALLLANSTLMRRVLDPFIGTANAIPRIVLAPYLLIALGIGIEPRIVMAASFVFFIVYFNVMHGISTIDRARIDHVAVLGGGHRHEILDLQIPVALAWTMRAFPQSVAYAFVGTVFQEFVGGNSGLGSVMIYGLNELNAATVMGTIVLLAVLGLVLLAIGEFIGARALPWRAEIANA